MLAGITARVDELNTELSQIQAQQAAQEPDDEDTSVELGDATAPGLPVACEAWESWCGDGVCWSVDDAPEQDPRARAVSKAIVTA